MKGISGSPNILYFIPGLRSTLLYPNLFSTISYPSISTPFLHPGSHKILIVTILYEIRGCPQTLTSLFSFLQLEIYASLVFSSSCRFPIIRIHGLKISKQLDDRGCLHITFTFAQSLQSGRVRHSLEFNLQPSKLWKGVFSLVERGGIFKVVN